MASSFLLLQSGARAILQSGGGFLLLQSSEGDLLGAPVLTQPLTRGTFLIELENSIRLQEWSSTTTTDVYTSQLNDDMFVMRRLDVDGAAYTAAASDAAVDSTERSWYLDPATHILRVHMAAGVDPDTVFLVAVLLEHLARGSTVIKAKTTGPVVCWEGRGCGLPSFYQRIIPEEFGIGSFASLGELTIDNRDGYYDALIGTRTFTGYDVRIYYGDLDAAFSTYRLWLSATMETPTAAAHRLSIPLVNLASLLGQPAIERTFETTDFASMDTRLVGRNIPVAMGSVIGALAYRIASGEWKWHDETFGAVTSIGSVVTQDGESVTVTGTDHANGEFTVDASYNTHDRLYVTGVGASVEGTTPGALIRYAATNFGKGLEAAQIDGTELADLDTERPVDIGMQVSQGSVRDVLDAIGESAFVDWTVNRANQLGARIRARDFGNIVDNSGFEVDTAGWTGASGATVARVTSLVFAGVGALSIAKPSASPSAHATTPVSLSADDLYVATCVARILSGGPTTAARIAIADSGSSVYLSDPVELSSTRWTRLTVSTALPIGAAGTGEVRVYPEYNGSTTVTIVIDEVDVAKAILLDDRNAEFLWSRPRERALWRTRVRYDPDHRTGLGPFKTQESEDVHRLAPQAQSRDWLGFLTDETDADDIASETFDFYSIGRLSVALRVYDPDIFFDVTQDHVILLQTTRRPVIPGDGPLYRLVEVAEQRPEDGPPRTDIVVEALYDPIFDLEGEPEEEASALIATSAETWWPMEPLTNDTPVDTVWCSHNHVDDKTATIFQAPKTGTLERFEMYCIGHLFEAQHTIRFSFQSLDASGNPDGTADQYRTITGTNLNGQWVQLGALTSDGTDGGTKRSVVAGEWLAAVVDYTAHTGGVFQLGAPANFKHFNAPYKAVNDDGGGWVRTSVQCQYTMALKYSDGTYPLTPDFASAYDLLSVSYNVDTVARDEMGMKFTVPTTVVIDALYALVDLDGNADFVLYDGSSNVLASVSMLAAARRAITPSGYTAPCAEVTLTPGNTYRLVLKPTTTTNIHVVSFQYDTDVLPATHGGVSDCFRTERVDGGAWTDSTDKKVYMAVRIKSWPAA